MQRSESQFFTELGSATQRIRHLLEPAIEGDRLPPPIDELLIRS